jgi:flavin reductase (DIM6/NTAB) family NADH-FMN oxidoreductase RutF
MQSELLPGPGLDWSAALRHAMGQFVTGVTVVTTVLPDGSPAGCTVNAFCSVSEEPPLVLICIGRTRFMHDALVKSPGYVVNILRADQAAVARRFATAGADRFTDLPTRPGRHGIPLLNDAVAAMECDRTQVMDGGDHAIVLGAVRRLEVTGGSPLLYAQGKILGFPAADLDDA